MASSDRISTDLCERMFATLVPFYRCDIDCLLEFTGQIDDGRLKQAFLAALADEPMWSYRFVTAFWSPYWEAIAREDRERLFEIVETNEDWQPAFRELARTPVDAAVKLIVFRGPRNDILCFRVDHRLADATAARFLIDAVAAHFRAGHQPTATDRPLQRRTMSLLHSVVSVEQRQKNLKFMKAFLKEQKKFPPAFQLPPVTKTDPADVSPILFYPAGSVEQLSQRAMRDRCTPTMALMAATYLALRDVVGIAPQTPLTLGNMVNLRRYLPPSDTPATASMLIGQMRIRVEEADATSMSAVIEQVRVRLAEQRGSQMGLIWSSLSGDVPRVRLLMNIVPYALLRWGLHQQLRKQKTTPDVVVSDLGEFGRPGDRWGDATLRNAYACAGVWGMPSISICSSTCGSQLSIAVGASPHTIATKLAQALRQRLDDYVGWSCNTP